MSSPGEGYEAIKLHKSSEVTKLMDERHILDEEVRQVIYNAEKSGDKLYQPETNRYLAKQKLQKATFYVEYSAADGGYTIHTAYAHKAEIMVG